MAIEHVNRKGDTYYLHAGTTRTGKPRYFFSKKRGDTPVNDIPVGYEVYESPEAGLVFLRRAKPVLIAPFEREVVSNGIRRYAGLEHFVVDAQQNSLVVWLPVTDENELAKLGGGRLSASPSKMQPTIDSIMRRAPYAKMMRFLLADEDERLFHAERWCFLGSIDQWVHLGGSSPLWELVEKYVKHLGKASFFDLM